MLRWATASVVLGALAAAGCSGAAPSNGIALRAPAAIVAAAGSAAQSARTVTVSGSYLAGGTSVPFRMQLSASNGAVGHVTVVGEPVAVVASGGQLYFSGGPAFSARFGGPYGARLFAGRWLQAPLGTGELAALRPWTAVDSMISLALHGASGLRTVGVTTIDGRRAVAVAGAHGAVLYVAATGSPCPVALTLGDHRAAVSFSNWGEHVSVVAPRHPIDIAALQGT
jgi:hypothetical protein